LPLYALIEATVLAAVIEALALSRPEVAFFLKAGAGCWCSWYRADREDLSANRLVSNSFRFIAAC
jgi:hypothetical protein